MTEKSTFVKLNRKILRWRWYQNANTFRVFVHLILLANITDRDFEQITVKRGQLVTSRKHLSRDLKISEQSVRTALEHLKSTNEITISTTSKFSIITINNYDLYQRVTHSPTSNQPATNQRPTSNQPQYKNGKECIRMVKNEREGTLSPFGRFKNVLLTQSELDELKTKFPNDYEAKIERLSIYQESKGKSYDNHFATLLDWLEADRKDEHSEENVTKKASYDIDELDRINTLDDFV